MQDLIRRALPAVAALTGAFILPSAASGATRSFIVADFDSIRVEAPIAVAVATRRGVTARAEGDADMLDRIDLRLSGRVLVVRLKRSPFESRRDTGRGPPTRLFLTVPSLRGARLAGAGTLMVEGMRGERTEIVAAGSGSLRVTGIDSANLSIALMGAGQLFVSGKAQSTVMRLSGSGSIDARGLAAADLDLMAEGIGTLQAQADRAARIVAIGAASVSVDGRPACTVRHVGSGTVVCGGADF